jgi:acylphosphatase
MQTELARVRAKVHGRVQMVGFRDFVVRHARSLKVAGTVRNRSDGTVECVLEGPHSEVERMLQLLQEGPRAARVDRLEVEHEQATGALGPMEVR